jgi:predicted CXXCH cytochrome family protein
MMTQDMNKMRRTVIIGFIALFSVISFYGYVDARVKGKCKDCHTMHDSYEGKEMTYGGLKGPFPVLTEGGCLGCHGQNPSGTENIITTGKARIPQVLHHMENGDLAAGNFYYVADGYNPVYSKGHNVSDISLPENPPMNVPPAFIGGVIIPGGTGPMYWPEEQQLTCAGTWGCHGDRTIEDPFKAIYGAHHTDDSEIDGSTVGKSYRFLYGITGKEHIDWEYLATIDNHNGYKGNFTHDTMDTISYLCGECHVKFHPHPNLGGSREVGQAYNSAWRRHPADIAFSTVHGGGFAGSEYQGYIKYSLEAPVAFYKPTGGETEVDEDSIVMCLSCHRAHASPYPDILRWDYNKIFVGSTSTTGCLTCHTKK